MSRAVAALTPFLLAAAWVNPLPASASGSAVAETCQGRPATIVGTPGEPVRGTGGDDVIVANGASRVLAGDGDDRICVDTSGTFEVSAGAGDDSVTTSGSRGASLTTTLGPGADTFVGGPALDFIYGDSTRAGSDTEADTISTGGGRDRIFSGAPGRRNSDVIDSGGANGGTQYRCNNGGDFSCEGTSKNDGAAASFRLQVLKR